MVDLNRRRFVSGALASLAAPAWGRSPRGLGTPYKLNELVLSASGREGEYDRVSVDCPFVFRRGGLFYMTFVAFDGTGYQTGLASSRDS